MPFQFMPHYRLFGGTLFSDLELPELEAAAPQTPTWTLRSVAGSLPEIDGEQLGADHVTGDVRVRMFRNGTGLRMRFDDTGRFDISGDGTSILWAHEDGVDLAAVRADLTSRVIAAALYAAGTLCLHCSAVVTGSEAIGFMAPKFHGKSTLALALVRSGARLLTDDTLPVTASMPAMARPGLHATRLWPDSADRVAPDRGHVVEAGSKRLYSAMPEELVTHDVHPLVALYVLAPTRTRRGVDAVWRTPLSSMESTLAMIGHSKLAPLLAGSEAPRHFRRAAEIARLVPVFRLNVVRDLDSLDDVVATIRSWHSSEDAAA